MRRALAAATLLGAISACGSARHAATSDGSAADDAPVPTPACSPGAPVMPRAFIGPDVSLRVVCGGSARAPIASVDEHGAGISFWQVTLSGDPAFTVQGEATFRTCATASPTVATVQFVPPPTALPGDTFDAVATVIATRDVFPTGTVKLHGEVFQPVVTVDRTSVDFGVSDLQVLLQQTLTFHVETDGAFIAPPHEQAPFGFTQSPLADPAGVHWTVFNMAAAPGDYTYDSVWTVSGDPTSAAAPACAWSVTIPVHIRVVDRDAGADGQVGDDGGSDGP